MRDNWPKKGLLVGVKLGRNRPCEAEIAPSLSHTSME